jgi:hypothetical protein
MKDYYYQRVSRKTRNSGQGYFTSKKIYYLFFNYYFYLKTSQQCHKILNTYLCILIA